MSYICMYLYNYLLFIPSVHIFMNIYVQKILIGISWWYIAMYLRRCARTLVLKIEWTLIILSYIKSCRYGIILIVIFGKKLTWQQFMFFTFDFFEGKTQGEYMQCHNAITIIQYNTSTKQYQFQ